METSTQRVSVPQPTPRGRRRWAILSMAFLIIGLDFWEKTTLSMAVANTGFLHAFNLPPHAVVLGALTSIGLAGYGIGNVLWGFVVDRIGARKSGVIDFLVGAIALICIGFSPNLGFLMVCQFIVGLVTGGTFSISNQLYATWFPFSERGRVIGIGWTAVGVFPTFLVPIMAALMVYYGWRSAYWILGIAMGVILVPVYVWVVRDSPERDPSVGAEELQWIQEGRTLPATGRAVLKQDTSTTGGILKSGVYWLNVVYTVANGQVMWGMMAWAMVYLVTARHFSFLTSGIYIAIATALQAVFALALGWSTDRLGGRRAPVGIMLWTVVILSIIVCFKVPAAMIALVGFVFMRGSVPNGPIIGQAILHSVIPPQTMGRGAGIQAAFNNILAGVSPLAVGVLFAVHHDWTLPFVWLSLWALVALAATVRFQTLRL